MNDLSELIWEKEQNSAFSETKLVLTSRPVLEYYDLNADVTFQSNTTCKSVGALFLQNEKSVVYSPRGVSKIKIISKSYGVKDNLPKTVWGSFQEVVNICTISHSKNNIGCLIVIYKRSCEVTIADVLSRDRKNDYQVDDVEELEVQLLFLTLDIAIGQMNLTEPSILKQIFTEWCQMKLVLSIRYYTVVGLDF